MFLEAQAIIQETLLPTTRHTGTAGSFQFPSPNSQYVLDPSSSIPAIDVSKFAAIRIYVDSLEGVSNLVHRIQVTFDKQTFEYPWANYLLDRTVLTVPVTGRLMSIHLLNFATVGGVQMKVEGLYQALPQRQNWVNGLQVPDPHPVIGANKSWGTPDPVQGITTVPAANGVVNLAPGNYDFWLPSPNASRVMVECSIRSVATNAAVLHSYTVSNPAIAAGGQLYTVSASTTVQQVDTLDFYSPAIVKVNLTVATHALNFLVLRLRALL